MMQKNLWAVKLSSDCPPILKGRQMENKNIACRIFKEQIDLVLALPEQDRAEVLYKAIISVFNQFDNQIENQNEYVYVSVSDSVSIIGKKVFNLLEKNIVCKEFSNNYGGRRIGAGKKKTEKPNQIENQNDIQNEKSKFNEDSVIYVNGQYFDEFPPESIPTLKKHWSVSELEEIRKDLAFKSDHTTTVSQMLLNYPPKPKTTRFVKPTIEEIKAYCEERKNNIDANNFFDNYEMKGWKINGSPMKDWKAAVRTWERRDYNRPQQPQKKNWSNYVGEGSFLKDPKDDPFYAEIFNKKD